MKKRFLFLATMVCLLTNGAWAQTDAKAQKILDEVSKNYKSYKTLKAAFNYTLQNKAANINETQKGLIYIKGNKFKLEISGQEIFCDNKTIWTLNSELKEVYIDHYNAKEAELNPADIFTMYQKGFLYKFVQEKKQGPRTVQLLELTPKDKNKPFFKVKLTIDKATRQIVKSAIYNKDGNIYTYVITKQQPNFNIADRFFKFEQRMHPGVTVFDLR